MKSKFTYFGLMAVLLSACSTGGYVSSSYTDDIYFNPGDVPPPIVASATSSSVAQNPGNTIIVGDVNGNEDGTNTMDNYIFEGTESDASALQYGAEQEGEGFDTISYYEDGELKYLIDNYIDDNGNVDYAYRINRFHNVAFYDPFYWNSWYYDPYCYYPGWSMSLSWGWGYPGYGWGYPGYGWGYPGYGWGYPGYYPPYYPGYYPPYYPGYPSHPNYPGGGYADYQYGQRRSSGTNVNRGARGASSGVAQNASGRNKSGNTELNGNSDNSGRRTTSSSGNREASQRNGVSTKSNTPNTNVLTEKRRTSGGENYSRQSEVNSQGNNTITRGQTQSYTRPGTNTQSRSYTRPSSSSSSVNAVPRVVTRSSTTGYAQPKSSSTYNKTYRSSSTYNRSSSSGTSARTYRSSTSSSPTYRSSATSRSSSSGSSYSSGSSVRSSGGSYSGSSGGSSRSSSGGGGSRSSGGGSSSSGRR